MIPYFEFPSLRLGPVTLQSFGVLAAAGVTLAAWLLVREAKRAGLDPFPMREAPVWALVGGMLGGHLMHVFLYHPEELHGWQLLKFWDGLSSTGGVLGGTLAVVLWFRLHGRRFTDYADAFAVAVAPGWAVARLGCFSVHDHPGSLTSFPLAVSFPGGARHDLGLYDALLLGAITAALFALSRRKKLAGRLLPLLALLYSVGRFFLDFLRATDVAYSDARYFGLTPAQYVCMALFAYGSIQLLRGASRPVHCLM
ncbi:MAG TPA: prolipoprotein diacylglyceryl transferase family protein [Myxococcales bacterium]|jgi:phosphatidylglycerol:prolipoprotein diacylglycerol transferase|nr:prolipoprotein diacylglyceryl transferase family protein [Myxococcales bacterium]HZX95176.1 prolipoprotein diacylglyceryl transferase family protein [Myxococcales bacterium]